MISLSNVMFILLGIVIGMIIVLAWIVFSNRKIVHLSVYNHIADRAFKYDDVTRSFYWMSEFYWYAPLKNWFAGDFNSMERRRAELRLLHQNAVSGEYRAIQRENQQLKYDNDILKKAIQLVKEVPSSHTQQINS